jgi:hypothetical protein
MTITFFVDSSYRTYGEIDTIYKTFGETNNELIKIYN